jgi:CDP-diacylglycerol--inositol 3-phosphatidyltransferase
MILLGYFRLSLIAFAWFYLDKPIIFLPLYITQVLLDGLSRILYSINLPSLYCIAVDGWTARRFNQVTKFGAWLDVIIDNIGRGILWTRISSVRKKTIFNFCFQ